MAEPRDTAVREALVARMRTAIIGSLTFPPGIDLGRGGALTQAADRALREVERVLDVPWLAGCTTCGGSGRVPCGCWEGCPSMDQCSTCRGLGKVPA